jgi:hypothetical protein
MDARERAQRCGRMPYLTGKRTKGESSKNTDCFCAMDLTNCVTCETGTDDIPHYLLLRGDAMSMYR